MAHNVGVSIRFVPAGIYTPPDSGQAVVRGAIVLMPDATQTQYVVDLEKWPTAIQKLFTDTPLRVFWKPVQSTSPGQLPGNGTSVAAEKVSPQYEPGNLGVAQTVWGQLLAPPYESSTNPNVALLLKAHASSPILNDAYLALTDPWGALIAATTQSQSDDRIHQFLSMPPAPAHAATAAHTAAAATPTLGTPRVSCAPLAKTAQLLSGLDSIRVIDAVCRAVGSPQGLAFEKNATVAAAAPAAVPAPTPPTPNDLRRLRWTGLPHLFSGVRTDPEGAPDPGATDWASWTLPRIAARGFRKAINIATDVNQALASGTPLPDNYKEFRRFRYLAPPPQPKPKLTSLLADKIRTAIDAHKAIADNIFYRTISFLNSGLTPDEAAARRARTAAKNTGAVWMSAARSATRRPASGAAAGAIYDAPAHRIANSLWPKQVDPSTPPPGPDLTDLHSATQTAIAMHLIDIRPDDARDLSQINIKPSDLATGSDSKKAVIELEKFARDVASAPQRRLFGVLAYPALARALRLVVDVEFSLPTNAAQLSRALPDGKGAHFLWFGASFDDHDDQIPFWTAAKLRSGDNAHFGVCSKEEIEKVAYSLHTLDGDDNPNPPQFEGVVTLGGDFDGGGPRFALESLDVITRLEQYVNASDSEANAEQGGQRLQHAGSAVSPARTAGIVLHDRGRAMAVTTQLARMANQVNSTRSVAPGATPPPTPLFADDLNVGFRADVAVLSRQNADVVWRGLADRWITFNRSDIEQLVQGTLNKARPRNLSADQFRLWIDAQGVKFPTRVIVQGQPSLNDKAKAAQQVAQEIVLQWLGPPLGAPPSDGADETPTPGVPQPPSSVDLDPATDLPLGVTLDLISNNELGKKVGLPPWLQVGRGFRIGMSGICLGGISVPLAEAAKTYDTPGLPLTIPQTPETDNFFVFRRHEPVAAPVVALLYQGKNVPPKDPRGDTLTDIVVRSRNGTSAVARQYEPTAHSVRVVYVRGVPQSFAALHPTQPGDATPPHMALQDLRAISANHGRIKRLCGGFQHVALDPQSGGLPVGWQGRDPQFPPRVANGLPVDPNSVSGPDMDSVFWILDSASDDDLAARKAQYFPDPAVSGFVVEARIRGPRPRPPERKLVPIYDPGKQQAVTHDAFHRRQEPVKFPHAMPIYFEVNALSEADAAKGGPILADLEFGSIQYAGLFSRLDIGSKPSVTATHVRVNLAPGDEVELRIWCALTPEVVSGWFHTTEQILALASATGGATPDTLDPVAALNGLIRMFGATERRLSDLGLSGSGFSKRDLAHVAGIDNPKLTLVRDLVAKNIANALQAAPIAGLSHEVTLTATHAILQPRFAPVFVRRDSLLGPPLVCGAEDEAPVGLLRHTFDTPDKWSDWLKAGNHRDVSQWPRWQSANPPGDVLSDFHQPAASTTWFGGIVALDLGTTSQLMLRASYLDVNDDPANWPSKQHPLNKDGTPKFATAHLELFRTTDLQKESSIGTIKDSQGHDLDLIDLLEATDGTIRALSWQFGDTRARRLTVQYVALSRFWNYFVKQQDFKPDAMPAAPAAFEIASEERTVWLPSTQRPEPIAKVEFLPAFVYVAEEGLQQRSRHFRARLRMRRTKVADGRWFSSGEGEQLAVVLWPPDLFNPGDTTNIQDTVVNGVELSLNLATTNFNLGPGGQYISRWGSDPIREGGADPSWLMSRKVFQENLRSGNARFVDRLGPGFAKPTDSDIQLIYMPIPTPSSDPASAPGGTSPPQPLQVCLLCFDPIYDPVENLWYVDVAIDPGPVARPFVRLGLVRFQEHSLRGLEVSEPITVQFQLEPYRRIRVFAREKRPSDPGWPIEIAVYGPSSVVAGGRRVTGVEVEPAQKAYQKQRIPQFNVRLLHDGVEYLESEYKLSAQCSTEDELKSQSKCEPFGPNSELGPPPDDEIWRAVIYVPHTDPADDHHPHDVIIEEVDLMLPASMKDIAESKHLSATGPRFAAKVRVRRLPDVHH